MRKLAVFLMLIFVIVMTSPGFAARGTLGGSWNYTLEGSGHFDTKPASYRITGNLNLNSDNDSYEDELLQSYSISYDGFVKHGGKRDEFKGNYSEKFPTNTFVQYKGNLDFGYNVLIGSKDVAMEVEIKQESANKITGKATLSGDAGGVITLLAYRNPEKGSVEGCNTIGINPLFILALVPLFFKVRN